MTNGNDLINILFLYGCLYLILIVFTKLVLSVFDKPMPKNIDCCHKDHNMKAQHEFKTIIEHQEYLRTYFAAMAMQGILANTNIGGNSLPIELAIDSVKLADALIKALNETKP